MLESKDLRLGNWIKWNDEIGAEVKVTGITETSISFSGKYRGEMEISKFTGIPITKEWLEKLGLNKETKRLEVETDYGNIIIYMNRVKIHQLQNIIHSLTGKELTIKE